jgi:head-tail adaptor
MSYASLLPHLCNVSRTSQTADGSGGFTATETIVLRRVPCRFNAMSSKSLAIYADKLGTLAGFTVYMEAGRRVLEGDMLVKCDDARQFDVLLVKNYDELGKFLTIECAERARAVE